MNRRSGIESKKRIVNAAMNVFSRKGYAKASIREIAMNAEISTGGVYLYFKNKEDLYKSIIQEKRLNMSSKVKAATELAESATLALSEFFRLYIENAIKHKEFILLHIREHGFTFGAHEKRQFFKKQLELAEQIIQRGIDSNEFRECNAKEMATIIMGSLRGITLTVALDDDVHITPKMLNEFVFKSLLKAEEGANKK